MFFVLFFYQMDSVAYMVTQQSCTCMFSILFYFIFVLQLACNQVLLGKIANLRIFVESDFETNMK